MPNRLANETSPYLRQHADNPVDWYPWGDEALKAAGREQRPILLSIGYSACHWCHVMAHESFEDAETAAVMNRLYVNIKVDREERPDLDHIYQTAHQFLTGRAGGWPLTMFLSPEGVPFFGGTYFPKTPRFGLIGFVDLLERVSAAWSGQRQAIEAQNRSMLAALAQTLPLPPAGEVEFDARPIVGALAQLEEQFDSRWGGFGGAPKFPHPTDLALLLASGEARHRDMALFSLRRMAEGGLFDHLGGGFCRYSVDSHWSIPHFEKMLYDNGQLLALYADAWALSGDVFFRRVAEMTAAWVLREMRSPEGGFYSALDADSEGGEGRYYVWTLEQLRDLLDDEEYAACAKTYGLGGPPNFEERFWHLRLSGEFVATPELERAREKLLAARGRRVRPGCDDKILSGWNGLMIAGLLRAARRLGCGAWAEAGQGALDFVRSALWRDGRLLAAYKDGRAHLNAYLDDHAFLLAACLESMQVAFRQEDLDFAIVLADALLERFEDREAGGFFFTSHDHEHLVHRAKIGHDAGAPAGNGVAALALQRLAAITGKHAYSAAAGHALHLFYPELSERPAGSAGLLAALSEWLRPASLVVLRGPAPAVAEWQRTCAGAASVDTMIIPLPGEWRGLPPPLAKPSSDRVNAWVCRGVNCLPPIDDQEALLHLFASR